MGDVAAAIKVMPQSPDIDLEELQDRLELLFERENRSDDTQDAERTDHVANVEAWSQLTSEVLRE